MFHLSAYNADLGTVANTDISAVSDEIIAILNGHLLLPQDMSIVAAFAGSATLNRARLNSPTLRQMSPPYIRPFNPALLPQNDPNLAIYVESPLRVRGQEELQIEATSDIAMGTERFAAFVWLQDREDPAPIGDPFTIRAVSTTTTVARSWTNIALTFDSQLPAGTYAVVGAEYIGTTAQAFRVIFDNQYLRPGGLGTAILGNRTHKYFYNGRLGRWGNFRTFSLPRVEALTDTAIAVHTIYFQVVRVGA